MTASSIDRQTGVPAHPDDWILDDLTGKRQEEKMATEIIVDKAELQSCKNQIDALANTVRNRSFSVCFSAARGDTVTELSELAARLSEMRSALADVFAGTSASVANMIAAFETTDSKAAETFHFMGVITDDD